MPGFECRWDAPGPGQVDHAVSSPYYGMNELKSARLLRLAQRYTVLSDGPARPLRSLPEIASAGRGEEDREEACVKLQLRFTYVSAGHALLPVRRG